MNLNKVMLIGRLGKDPEIRYTQSGSAVGNFSIATTDTWKDKGGEKKEKTEWHNVVVWGKQADFAQNYLKKGKLIYVEGRLQTSNWTDTQNVKHYRTEINANTITFMEKLSDSPSGVGGSAPSGAPASSPPVQENEEVNYVEDDIPF